MSTQQSDEDPLLIEDNFSGKIFCLNIAPDYDLDLDELRRQLDGKSFVDDISDTIDEETTFVPEIFKRDGDIVSTSDITSAKIVENEFGRCIIANVVLDDATKIKYRNNEILVLDTTDAKFIVTEHAGEYYLVALARREVAESVATILKQKYRVLGSSINETSMQPAALEEVREAIDARLKDTIITDYPESELESVQMRGDELQDHRVYEEESSRGKLKTYMLQTDQLVPNDPKTLGVSRDGLVRLYSNATIGTYLKLLHEYILPRITRDSESSPDLGAYTSSEGSIFNEVETDSDRTSS